MTNQIEELTREICGKCCLSYEGVGMEIKQILARGFPDSDPKPCECLNWCRVQPPSDDHHVNCPQYKKPEPDPRHAAFGKLMWEMIREQGGDFCESEWSEEVLPLAQKAGLCQRVQYDPEIHGDINAEPGDAIWYWGKTPNTLTMPADTQSQMTPGDGCGEENEISDMQKHFAGSRTEPDSVVIESAKSPSPAPGSDTIPIADTLQSVSGAEYRKVRQEVIALREEVRVLSEAANLALEYWKHRQQRYKNRRPAWVIATEEALKQSLDRMNALRLSAETMEKI